MSAGSGTEERVAGALGSRLWALGSGQTAWPQYSPEDAAAIC